MKPVKKDFKVWVWTDSSNWYVDKFIVYMGKSDGPATNLGYKVVIEVCKDIFG